MADPTTETVTDYFDNWTEPDVTLSDVKTGSIDDLIAKARAESDKETPTAPGANRSKPGRSRGKRSLKEPLTDFYATIGAGAFIISEKDGVVILANAEKMAESLDNWGKTNPQVYKVLERMCTTGAFGAVLAAHAPVIMAILNNHNVIPTIMGKNADENKNDQTATFTGAPTVDSENPNGYVAPVGTITPLIMETR